MKLTTRKCLSHSRAQRCRQPQPRTDHIAAITRILWASKLDHDVYNELGRLLALKCGAEFRAAPIKGAFRCLEKVVLKSRASPACSKLKQAGRLQDTLRGMLLVDDSATMLMAINILAACDRNAASTRVLKLNGIEMAGGALEVREMSHC